MTIRLRSLLCVGVLIGLAACGNNGSNPPPPPPVVPPAPVARVEDQFGTACFAPRYRADPNTKATDPVPCPDLPPVNPAIKPVAL